MDPQTTLGRARSLEGSLVNLRGIRKARVDVGPEGETSIEVLGAPEHSDAALRQQVVRLARSVLGPDAVIRSVKVLIAAKTARGGRDHPRRKLSSLITRRTHERFSTQVILSREGDVVTGEAECALGQKQADAVAQAVIDGLDEVSPAPLELKTVDTVAVGDTTLVIVALTFGERPLLGGAEVRFDLPDAIVRATLHALNRSLSYAR